MFRQKDAAYTRVFTGYDVQDLLRSNGSSKYKKVFEILLALVYTLCMHLNTEDAEILHVLPPFKQPSEKSVLL